MTVEAMPLTVRLKAREEDRLLAGHAWVFSNEIEKVEGEAEAGALAAAVTAGGAPLGVGFYHPNSLIAWRLLSRRVEPVDAAFFKERLGRALAVRERLYPGEKSYRLCFGESDGLPGLVVDRYADVLVCQVLSAGIERRLDLVAQALTELLQPAGIFLKNDHPARGLEGLPIECRVLQGEVPPRVTIEEAGLRFVTPVTEGQKTGFYFDQRDNRARLAPYFQGRQVLDLYCYTGAFALNAARHGAKRVLGLDSSAPAVALARENAALNGLAADFDEGDAEEVLHAFSEKSQPIQPDFILLDPPSFAPSKRHVPKALRAYTRLNQLAMRTLPRGGLLATSTCAHHVDREAFVKMLREAAGRVGRPFKLLELGGQAKDHPMLLSMPETEYLHFALLEAA